jgi:hypothetical protein
MKKTIIISIFSLLFLGLVAPVAEASFWGNLKPWTTIEKGLNQNQIRSQAQFKYDPACIQNAIIKRESLLIGALDKFNAAIKAAMTTRLEAQKNAWAITDQKQRREAIKKAWADWKTAWKKAAADLKTDRKNAWNQFQIEKRACGVDASEDSAGIGSEGKIE